MEIGDVMPIHIIGLCGEHEVALFAAIRRAKCLALGVSCCVIRHHRAVLREWHVAALDLREHAQKALERQQGALLQKGRRRSAITLIKVLSLDSKTSYMVIDV